jgi:TolB protein
MSLDRWARLRWLLLAGAAFALLVPPSASGGLPGANGRIAFDVITPGNPANRGIFSVTQAGATPKQLRTDRVDRAPAYSPDGSKIAYECSGDICVMSATGRDVEVLAPDDDFVDSDPAWSRDGRWIYFSGYAIGGTNPNFDIFRIDIEGTDVRQVTKGPADDYAPAVSPTTNRVVFERRGELYSVRTNGSGLRRLTRDGPRVLQTAPDFAPNGKRIVFVQQRSGGRGSPALRTMRPNGSRKRTLLKKSSAQPDQPVWSPDGKEIAFVDDVGAGSDIHVIPARGTRREIARQVEELVDWEGSLISNPTWQPR